MSETENGTNDQDGDGQQPLIVPPKKTSFVTKLRNYFLAGIVITAPISLTIYLTWLFIDWVDRQVTPLLPAQYNPETYLPFSIPGLGLLIMVVFLTFVGFVAANLFGRTLINLGERLVNRMPVVRTLYNAFKQILETVLQSSSQSFRQVVMLEYPRRGIWAVAFVTADTTGEIARRGNEELINIFLPTTPNPTSGFLLMVPKRDLIFLDMSVEEAAKFVISAGVIMPADVGVETLANVSGAGEARPVADPVAADTGQSDANNGRRNSLLAKGDV